MLFQSIYVLVLCHHWSFLSLSPFPLWYRFRLNNFSPAPGLKLTLHVGIGAGVVAGIFVGGVNGITKFTRLSPRIARALFECELIFLVWSLFL